MEELHGIFPTARSERNCNQTLGLKILLKQLPVTDAASNKDHENRRLLRGVRTFELSI